MMLVLCLICLPLFTFQGIGLKVVKVAVNNVSMAEIEELQSIIPFRVEVDENGILEPIGEIEFHNCFVYLPSLSAPSYVELASSNTIISGRVKQLQETLMVMFNTLTYNCFKPLSKTMGPLFDHCTEIFSMTNHTMWSLSKGIRKIRNEVEEDVEKLESLLYHPEDGLYTRWNQYVSNDWQVYTENIMGGYTDMLFYIRRSVYTKFVVDFILIGIFGVWVIIYIARLYPSKPTFSRILNSYAAPAVPLFVFSGIGVIILGFCVIFDPSGIKKFFISEFLLCLFFVVGFFLLFQFFVITVWTVTIILRILYRCCLMNGNGKDLPPLDVDGTMESLDLGMEKRNLLDSNVYSDTSDRRDETDEEGRYRYLINEERL